MSEASERSEGGSGSAGDGGVARWITHTPYARAIGVACEALDAGGVTLRLPYSDANANPGKALHGGCAASLAVIASQALGRSALGAEAAPFHTAGLQVQYLAAAIGEDVITRARLLRRGKELCFVAGEIATEAGKPIAQFSSCVRGRFAAPPAVLARAHGDDGRSEPGRMGPHIEQLPFMAARGIRVEHMTGGTSRIVMPLLPTNLDADGHAHEGALLALLDTTGAMAAWAETGPGRYQASTPALQAQMLAPSGSEGLLTAYGRCVQRDRELFWCDVEIARADDTVCARGTVIYRIVT